MDKIKEYMKANGKAITYHMVDSAMNNIISMAAATESGDDYKAIKHFCEYIAKKYRDEKITLYQVVNLYEEITMCMPEEI